MLYVRLIPPGAADVAHYRVQMPQGRAAARSRFTAKLNYRKFAWYYTQFAYAGEPKPGQDPALLARRSQRPGVRVSTRRRFRRTSPARFATASRICRSSRWRRPKRPSRSGSPRGRPVVRKQDRERWNDWGIGLLLQGDLKGAEYAFQQGHRSRARVRRWLAERGARADSGRRDRRRQAVRREGARRSIRELGRIWFFKAADSEGRRRLRRRPAIARDGARRQYPRDRVVLNQIGAHPVPEARVRGGGGGAEAGVPRWIPKMCRCTTR